MAKERAPRVTTKVLLGRDADLEREDVRLSSGRALTPWFADEIVGSVRRSGGRGSTRSLSVLASAGYDPLQVRDEPRRSRARRDTGFAQQRRC